MAVSMLALTDDLVAESTGLRQLLTPLREPDWRRDTPAVGWTIADQVSHLAHFDDVAVQSATDPDAFMAERTRVELEGGIDPGRLAAPYRSMTGSALLGWFDEARRRLVAIFRGLDPAQRLPWYGPSMSAASSLTARIMETWAHGQDVADTLGVSREPTARLRHVAHIGVSARAYSFAVNGLTMPDAPIRVELAAPDGSTWTWGPNDAADRVGGAALDFCLAVTQRRHLDDLDLAVVGPHARQWMGIAQAFAGPAGLGRTPGQFGRTRPDGKAPSAQTAGEPA